MSDDDTAVHVVDPDAAASNGMADGPEPQPIQSQVGWVTPTLARQWLTAFAYDRQRHLRLAHAEMLAAAISRDEFKSGAIEFYHCNGRIYLTDGQHRLKAITLANKAVLLTVIRHTVDSVEDVHTAYRRTDRGVGRTYYDLYTAAGLAEELGLTRTETARFGAAVVHIMAGFLPLHRVPSVARSSDRRIECMREWAAPAQALFPLYAGTSGRWQRALTNAVPLAVALVTMRYQPGLAVGFWRPLARREGLEVGSPQHSLMKCLDDRAGYTARDVAVARACAAAWNAYCDGRSLKQVKLVHSTKPIAIRGTPHAGRSHIVSTSVYEDIQADLDRPPKKS